MELEIKHLESYLLHGLNVMFNKKHKGKLYGLIAGKWNLAEIEFEYGNDRKEVAVCFPVLRPLSDLLNVITVNGKTFIPFNFLLGEYKKDLGSITDYHCLLNIEKINREIESGRVSMRIYSHLLDWHFDVFGLIENGLAVDINSL